MSLVSRTHFEVFGLGLRLEAQALGLGLGLEACKSSKMPCPLLEDSTTFWLVKKENNQIKININFYLVCQFSCFSYLKIIQCDSQEVIVNVISNGFGWKPLIGEWSGQGERQCRIVLFGSVNASGAGGTNSKALKPSGLLWRLSGILWTHKTL